MFLEHSFLLAPKSPKAVSIHFVCLAIPGGYLGSDTFFFYFFSILTSEFEMERTTTTKNMQHIKTIIEVAVEYVNICLGKNVQNNCNIKFKRIFRDPQTPNLSAIKS